jgi:hypothetical protein
MTQSKPAGLSKLAGRTHIKSRMIKDRPERSAIDSRNLRPKPCDGPSDNRAPIAHRRVAADNPQAAAHTRREAAADHLAAAVAARTHLQAVVRTRQEAAVHTPEAAADNSPAVEAADYWRSRCQ